MEVRQWAALRKQRNTGLRTTHCSGRRYIATAQARPKLGARLLARLLEWRISRLEAKAHCIETQREAAAQVLPRLLEQPPLRRRTLVRNAASYRSHALCLALIDTVRRTVLTVTCAWAVSPASFVPVTVATNVPGP